jgi:hypothetical protein
MFHEIQRRNLPVGGPAPLRFCLQLVRSVVTLFRHPFLSMRNIHAATSFTRVA